MDPLTITALLSAGTSIAQGIGNASKAKKQRRAYSAAESAIPEQDPLQVALLDNIKQTKKAFMSGTDPISSYTRQQSRNLADQTQSNLTRMGRGNASDLLRSQRMGDQAQQASSARSAQTGLGLMGMQGTLTNAMADRSFKTQWARANRLWSEYAQSKEDSNAQIMAGLGVFPDLAIEKSSGEASPRTQARRRARNPWGTMDLNPTNIPNSNPIPSPDERLIR